MLCEIFFSVKLRGSWELRTNPPTQCYITFLNNYSAGQQWEVASLGQIRGGAAELRADRPGSAHRASDGHKPDKMETKLISGIVRQFIVILIYSRYTKHARRSNFNFTIDIRDWTLTDSVRINLNYSGSIFVFWCPSLVPWVAPAHWPVSQSAAGVCHGPGPQRPWLRSLMQL